MPTETEELELLNESQRIVAQAPIFGRMHERIRDLVTEPVFPLGGQGLREGEEARRTALQFEREKALSVGLLQQQEVAKASFAEISGQRAFCSFHSPMASGLPSGLNRESFLEIKRPLIRETLVSFLGRLEGVVDATAMVSLINETTRERFEAECDLDLLSRKRIDRGDEFRCEVVREGGETRVIFRRLSPKEVPGEVVRNLRRQIEESLD